MDLDKPSLHPSKGLSILRRGELAFKEQRFCSGLGSRELPKGIRDIQDEMEGSAQQLGQGADGPQEAKGLEPPQLWGVTVVDDLLVVTVRPLAGGASRIEALPGLSPSLYGANQAGVLGEGHPVCITPALLAVRTPLLFLRRTLQSTDVLTAVGLVIVPVGATQPATGSIRGAVRIIASGPERLWGEGLVAGIIRDDGDASPPPDTAVVLAYVVARIGELDLLGQARDGDLGAMCLEMAALMDIGRVRGCSHG